MVLSLFAVSQFIRIIIVSSSIFFAKPALTISCKVFFWFLCLTQLQSVFPMSPLLSLSLFCIGI